MPGFVETLEFAEENVTGSVDYLKGNLYQKVTLTATIRFETWFNCLVDEEIVMGDPTMRPDFTTGYNNWIRDNTIGNRFGPFNVGDSIIISNSTTTGNDGTYLIGEKLNDAQIRITDALGVAINIVQDLAEATAKFTLDQDPQGMTWEYGLIENAEAINFISKVSGDQMKYEYAVASGSTTIPASATAMLPVGKLDWQLGSLTVENLTTAGERDNGTYRFEFVQVLYIHPFYLPNQLLQITNTFKKAPVYFEFAECLKHVFRAKAHRELSDPNVYQEIEFEDKDGNTGWYEEEYNGGTPEFAISNVAYSNTIGALTRDDTVTVTFDVDELGTNGADYVCVNFIMFPEQDNDYKNRNQLQQENYCWDRAYATTGSGSPINGENYSGNYRVLAAVESTVGAGQANVTANFEFGSEVKAKIDTLSDKRYAISAYVGSAGFAEEDANYTTLLVDLNTIQIEVPDATVDVTNEILFHDQNDNTTVSNNHEIKVEDEIVIDSLLLLDRTSLDLQINEVNLEIIATDGSETVTLETFKITFDPTVLVGGIRYINETYSTPFNVNSSEIRKQIKAYRSPSQDVSSQAAYRFQYPFLFRWEYWEQLFISGSLPADFLDTAQDFNGYNQDWIRLGGLSGWDIKYRVRTSVEVSGTLSEKITDETLTEKDYDGNSSEWDNPTLTTYDGATNLLYSSNPYIMTNKRTKVEIGFEYLGIDIIDETDVYMVARIIPKEGGTYIANDSFSSVWDRESVSLFTSNDGSTAGNGTIVITENAGIFTGTLYIDHTKLPAGVLDYSISWSINRDTATSRPDWGEVHVEDVKALEVIVADPTIDIEENPFKECCYPIKVLASSSDTDTYKNDFKGFLRGFPLQYTMVMTLEKYNETTATWSSVGTLANQVSRTKDNKTYYGHKVEWRDYLISDGEGKYRVKWSDGTNTEYSEEYCLYEYSQRIADETVRIEYTWNSIIGDQSQKKTRDFVGMNWPDQIRICDAVFYGRKGSFETESVKLESGEEKSVSKSFREEYSLEVRKAPMPIHKFMIYDVLMADEILISDYNSKNADSFVDISVEINSGYEPNYSGSRPYPSVQIGLVDKFNNRKKLYS